MVIIDFAYILKRESRVPQVVLINFKRISNDVASFQVKIFEITITTSKGYFMLCATMLDDFDFE